MKYPRTPHLPWSPGKTSDDRVIGAAELERLDTLPTIVTEKMDGGNVTMMRDAFYARSLDSTSLVWERRAKAEWAQRAHDIPEGWRVSCESMWARRSVAYDSLPAPVLVIGVWDTENMLPWNEVVEWAALLGLPTVPVIGEGIGTRDALDMWRAVRNEDTSEGFVVRARDGFPSTEFGRNVAKWVRPNHVRTSSDWRNRDDFAVNGFAASTDDDNEEEGAA